MFPEAKGEGPSLVPSDSRKAALAQAIEEWADGNLIGIKEPQDVWSG